MLTGIQVMRHDAPPNLSCMPQRWGLFSSSPFTPECPCTELYIWGPLQSLSRRQLHATALKAVLSLTFQSRMPSTLDIVCVCQ